MGTVPARHLCSRGPYISGDKAAMQAIVKNSRAYLGTTDAVVDYDHQSVFGL
jgi:hypothetical protein